MKSITKAATMQKRPSDAAIDGAISSPSMLLKTGSAKYSISIESPTPTTSANRVTQATCAAIATKTCPRVAPMLRNMAKRDWRVSRYAQSAFRIPVAQMTKMAIPISRANAMAKSLIRSIPGMPSAASTMRQPASGNRVSIALMMSWLCACWAASRRMRAYQ